MKKQKPRHGKKPLKKPQYNKHGIKMETDRPPKYLRGGNEDN
jgi:hypothetical protein